MRHAPPVSVLCRGREWQLAQAGVFGLAAAALSAWATTHAGLFWPTAVALAGAIGFGSTFLVANRLLHQPARQLRWDGRQWSVDDQAVQVRLMLQIGSFVLLRVAAAGQSRSWLAAGEGGAKAAWHGLLVALRAEPADVEINALGQGNVCR